MVGFLHDFEKAEDFGEGGAVTIAFYPLSLSEEDLPREEKAAVDILLFSLLGAHHVPGGTDGN